jgi:hypothetical protein
MRPAAKVVLEQQAQQLGRPEERIPVLEAAEVPEQAVLVVLVVLA